MVSWIGRSWCWLIVMPLMAELRRESAFVVEIIVHTLGSSVFVKLSESTKLAASGSREEVLMAKMS